MQLSGSSSWRFEEDNAQFLHLALFARDAAGLAPPGSPDLPPPLSPDVPGQVGLFPAATRASAASQWGDWWRRLLDYQVTEARLRREQDSEGDMTAWLRAMGARKKEVYDPPSFGSLEPMPELRAVVTATFDSALAWCNRRPRPDGSFGQRGSFDYQTVRSAAENAADSGIALSDVNAVVHVLEVQGMWSYLAGPGCALCSSAVAADRGAADELLRSVFARYSQ
jgi:hypothetical protein